MCRRAFQRQSLQCFNIRTKKPRLLPERVRASLYVKHIIIRIGRRDDHQTVYRGACARRLRRVSVYAAFDEPFSPKRTHWDVIIILLWFTLRAVSTEQIAFRVRRSSKYNNNNKDMNHNARIRISSIIVQDENVLLRYCTNRNKKKKAVSSLWYSTRFVVMGNCLAFFFETLGTE